MTPTCNVNGTITSEHDARVPVLDRGFLFGDSVYEVLRTRDRVPFAWPEHLERLRASADGIALALDLDDRAVLRRIKDTLAAAGDGDGEAYVRIIVTRGTGTAPSIDFAYAPGPPTWVVLVRPLPQTPAQATLAVVPRLRNDRRALDPAIKSGNYLNNVLGLAEAKARGATDCLFLNALGEVTEASTANFWLVRDGQAITPPVSAGLLRGTTRRLLFELADEERLPLREAVLTRDDLEGADEMFLSSTLRDVVPVVAVDGRPLGNGTAGPFTRDLLQRFAAFAERRSRERYRPGYEAV